MKPMKTLLCIAAGALLMVACGDSNGTTTGGSNGSSGSSGSSGSTTGTSGQTDPTIIATGLTDPQDLAITSDSVFWTSEPQQPGSGAPVPGTIQKVAITGGTPSTVIASSLYPAAMTTDGTSLYWIEGDASSAEGKIMKAGLDGSNPTELANGLDPDQDTRLAVVSGNLYWGAIEGVFSVPVAGGTPTHVITPSVAIGGALSAGDASGLYWTESDGSHTFVRHADLDGSNAVTLGQTANFDQSVQPQAISHDSTHAYWFLVDDSGSDDISSLYSAPIAGGAAATKVLDYTGDADDLAADDNGIYFHDDVASTEGIYKVTGSTATQIQRDTVINTSANNQRLIRLDASNVYWVAGGYNEGQAVLHKMAR